MSFGLAGAALLVAQAAASGCGSSSTSSASSSSSSGSLASGASSSGSTASSSSSSGAPGSSSSSSGGSDAASPSVAEALASAGFTTAVGSFQAFDLSQCCATGGSCAANNPASPYFGFFIPAGPGQTAENPNPPASGTVPVTTPTAFWRLREDEAVVYVGPTPPTSTYFGFTPYLYDRQTSSGARATIAASLEATTNNLVIHAGGSNVFGQTIAVIATANATTSKTVQAALTSAGVAQASINTVVFDETIAQLGLGASADTLGVLFRVALFDDADAGAAFVTAPQGVLYRVTPVTPIAAAPLTPVTRTPVSATNESALSASVDALETAILAAYPTMKSTKLDVSLTLSPDSADASYDYKPDPAYCIQTNTDCAGDNRDTNYPATSPALWLSSDEDFYIVYGVNHAATGKTLYSGVDVLAIDHLIGVGGVTSKAYTGSASEYVASDPNVGSLYAWKLATACAAGDTHCTVIPGGACPGIDANALATLQFRTYLDPASSTRPDWNTLVSDRVMKMTH